MKNKNGFIVPILLVVIALLLVCGGVYVYKNEKRETTNQNDTEQVDQEGQTKNKEVLLNNKIENIPETHTENIEPLAIQSILSIPNADFVSVKGASWKSYGFTVNKNKIVFGDVDRDGVDEAIAPVSYCSGSCGQSVYLFKMYKGKIIFKEIPETDVAGAAQAVDMLVIKKNSIAVTETDFGGTRTSEYQVYFVDGKFNIGKIQSSTTNPSSQNNTPTLGLMVNSVSLVTSLPDGSKIYNIIGTGFNQKSVINLFGSSVSYSFPEEQVNSTGTAVMFKLPKTVPAGAYLLSVKNASGAEVQKSNSILFISSY